MQRIITGSIEMPLVLLPTDSPEGGTGCLKAPPVLLRNMFELLHAILKPNQPKALCDMRPLRSLVPARFICLSTVLNCNGREGLDTVTRKKPKRGQSIQVLLYRM